MLDSTAGSKRAISSVGLERHVYTADLGGLSPSSPTLWIRVQNALDKTPLIIFFRIQVVFPPKRTHRARHRISAAPDWILNVPKLTK